MRKLLAIALALGCAAAQAQDARVNVLLEHALDAQPDRNVTMSIVEYPPGGSSKPHRHDAQVFVYVLEGTLVMQVKGGERQTLKPGSTFYEAPDDEHIVSENACTTQPAKFLVFKIQRAGAQRGAK